MGNVLNQLEGNYAIGGSYMLYLRGIVDHYHDLDIVCDSDTFDLLNHKWSQYEIKFEGELFSGKFKKFKMNGLCVDLMCEMKLPPNQNNAFVFPLSQSMIEDYRGIKIMSLVSWFVIYSLLGREEKANLIYDILEKNIDQIVGIDDLLVLSLPETLIMLLKRLRSA